MKRALSIFALAIGLFVPAWAADAYLILNLAPGTTYAEIAADYQVVFLDRSPGGPFALYSVDLTRKEAVEAAMATDPRIVWAEDDFELDSPEDLDQRPEDIRARSGGTIPAIFDRAAGVFYNQDSLRQINWRATGFGFGDRLVRVAILDTGLSEHQPVLWENVVAIIDATVPTDLAADGNPLDEPMGLDTNGNGEPDDAVGHGTFVTSIIATVAPYSRLVVAKVADSDGMATAWTVIKGIAFAVENECEFANISLGAIDQPTALGDVIAWAELNGLTVIAGAGNDSVNRARFPSRFTEVIGVSGVDVTDHKADFSNWDGHLRQAAPSVDIAGAWWKGGMVGWSGTSFAAPFVTGCLADNVRRRSRMTPEEVRLVCETTGVDINALNPLYKDELGLRVDWELLMRKMRRGPVISFRGGG